MCAYIKSLFLIIRHMSIKWLFPPDAIKGNPGTGKKFDFPCHEVYIICPGFIPYDSSGKQQKKIGICCLTRFAVQTPFSLRVLE